MWAAKNKADLVTAREARTIGQPAANARAPAARSDQFRCWKQFRYRQSWLFFKGFAPVMRCQARTRAPPTSSSASEVFADPAALTVSNPRPDAAMPTILAALLGAAVAALKNYDTIAATMTKKPRMADFACWAAAAAQALGWTAQDFFAAYRRNQDAAVENAIEADPVALAVHMFARKQGRWEGSVTGLLECLGCQVSDDVHRDRRWPKAAHVLSGRLRRVVTALKRVGVEIDVDLRDPVTRVKQIAITLQNSTDERSEGTNDGERRSVVEGATERFNSQCERSADDPPGPSVQSNRPESAVANAANALNASPTLPRWKYRL